MDRTYPPPADRSDSESKQFRRRPPRATTGGALLTGTRILIGIGFLLVAFYLLSSGREGDVRPLRRIDPTGLPEQDAVDVLPEVLVGDADAPDDVVEGVDYLYDDVEVHMSVEPIKGLPSLDQFDAEAEETDAETEETSTEAISTFGQLQDTTSHVSAQRAHDAVHSERTETERDAVAQQKLTEDEVATLTDGAVTKSDLTMTPLEYRVQQVQKERGSYRPIKTRTNRMGEDTELGWKRGRPSRIDEDRSKVVTDTAHSREHRVETSVEQRVDVLPRVKSVDTAESDSTVMGTLL